MISNVARSQGISAVGSDDKFLFPSKVNSLTYKNGTCVHEDGILTRLIQFKQQRIFGQKVSQIKKQKVDTQEQLSLR